MFLYYRMVKTQGSSNRQIYDNCAYQLRLTQSTDPLSWMLYDGKYENCGKCIYKDQFWRPFDKEIVDRESELRNITRPASKCNQYQYKPTCKDSQICTSTFDDSNPVVLASEVCPVIFNNIKKMTTPGYTIDRFSCNNIKNKK